MAVCRLDATYVKARRDHHIVSVAVIVAVGVNTDGRREVLGMTVGHSEAEPFWVEFLRSLARRGLRGVKLVVSDAHEGLKTPSPRCSRHLAALPGGAVEEGRDVPCAGSEIGTVWCRLIRLLTDRWSIGVCRRST